MRDIRFRLLRVHIVGTLITRLLMRRLKINGICGLVCPPVSKTLHGWEIARGG